MAAEGICSNCSFKLPTIVRFCPMCGANDPLGVAASATSEREPVGTARTGNAAETGASPLSTPLSSPPQPSKNARRQKQEHAEAAKKRETEDSSSSANAESSVPSPPPPAPAPKPEPNSRPYSVVAQPPAPSTSWGKRAVLIVLVLAGVVWFARPLLAPSDPCQSEAVSTGLNRARTSLAAKNHPEALAGATGALASCVDGAMADELRRMQSDAINAVVAEGRKCLRAMDVTCLVRVVGDLATVPSHPTSQAFNSELEKVVEVRTARDLKEAQACVETGNTDCADQRMKLPLAMRSNDAVVLELREQLEKSRTAVVAAQACLSGTQNDCVAAAIEDLRQVSPKSPLINQLEQRTPAVAPQPAATAATDRPIAPPQAASLSVTAHSISVEDQTRAIDPSGRPITQLTIQRRFDLSQPSGALVQEVFVVQTIAGRVLFRGSPNRTPELGNGNFGGRGVITLPMALEIGQYELKHQVLSGTNVLSERSLRFFSQGAPAQPPPQTQADPADGLVRRLMAEGERCRGDRDCGCMKDKAVAVSSIEPQNQWAGRMRQLASDCARAKLEIR